MNTPSTACSTPRRHRRAIALVAALSLTAAMLAGACQERREPTVSLTQEQWKRVKPFISDEAPSPKVPIGATFGVDGEPVVELVGYSIEPDNLVTGKEFKLTWYWKSLSKLDRNWKIFVHLTPKNGGAFQNLDHHPVDNLYQTSSWEPGDYVTDTQTGKLQAGFPSSGGQLAVGFWDERDGQRMQILDAGKGSALDDGTKLQVGDVGTENDKQLTAFKVSEPPTLDGVLNDPVWRVAQRTAPFVAPVDGKAVDFATTVRAVYTDEAVYFAFEARDRDLRTAWTQRDDRLWEQDCVEIYLNPDNDEGTYWELQISPGEGADGTSPIFDAYFEKHRQPAWEVAKNAEMPGMEVGVRRQGTLNSDTKRADDTLYSLEIKVPFTELTSGARGAIERIRLDQVPPPVGSTWRINFFRVDYTDTGTGKPSTRHAAWSPSGGDFHNLEAFGTLEFGAARDVGAQRPTAVPGATEEGPGRTIPSYVRTTITRTRFLTPASINRASAASRAAMRACFENDENTPTDRVQFEFDVNVAPDGHVQGVSRAESQPETSAIQSCVEEQIAAWQELELKDTRVVPAEQAGDQPPPIEPSGVDGELGFTLRVLYVPERTMQ